MRAPMGRRRWPAAAMNARRLRPHPPARRAGPRRGLAVSALDAGRRDRLAFPRHGRARLRRPAGHAGGLGADRAPWQDVDEKGWEIELDRAARPASRRHRSRSTRRARRGCGSTGGPPAWKAPTATSSGRHQEQPEFSPQRRAYFSPATRGRAAAQRTCPWDGGGGKLDTDVAETRTMIPVYRIPGWKGTITGLRIGFDNPGPAQARDQVLPHRLRHAPQHQQLELHPRLPRLLHVDGRLRVPARPDRPNPQRPCGS